MAHEIYISSAGKASMAYAKAGGVPWHSLGQAMLDGVDFDTWVEAAGFNFEILKAPVEYRVNGVIHRFPKRFALHRSDNNAPISIMSDRYRIVQPREILEFFRDVCRDLGMKMETAGVLREGAQYWTMVRTGQDFVMPGTNDLHAMFILLATAADGSLPTIGEGTGTRTVCANTLRAALFNAVGKPVRIKHNTEFDPDSMKKELGLVDFDKSWACYTESMRQLKDAPISNAEASAFFSNLLRPSKERKEVIQQEDLHADSFSALLGGRVKAGYVAPVVEKEKDRAIRGLAELENSYYRSPGACPGSLYGVLQGVTHYLDHERGNDTNRLSSAWFGQGAALKEQAFSQLMERAAR